MKTKIFLSVIIAFILASCAPRINFYQVYKVKSLESSQIEDDLTKMVFENEDYRITYNFWEEAGNAGFMIFNKTKDMLYLNLDESFFIKNGIAYDYYQEKTIANTSGNSSAVRSSSSYTYTASSVPLASTYGAQASYLQSNETSVSVPEKKIISIPSNTSKIISVFSVNPLIYRDCELLRYPREKEIVTKTFTATTSPYNFSNILIYRVGLSGMSKSIKHNFYIEEITNVPDYDFVSYEFEEFCGRRTSNYIPEVPVYKYISPSRFYRNYIKNSYETSLTH